jgi:hypothetical protein
LAVAQPRHAERRAQSLGSTGSLSSARTPNTHSWTRRNDS